MGWVGEGVIAGQARFSPSKMSLTLVSSNTAPNASAISGATDSTSICGSCFSGGSGSVLVSTIRESGLFFNRSIAGPERTPCVAIAHTSVAPRALSSSAAELLVERGAREVWAMATHGVLSGPAVDRLKNSKLERIVLSNTLPLPPEKQLPKIEVLSVAPLIAEALGAVFDDTSVSDIFDGENLA